MAGLRATFESAVTRHLSAAGRLNSARSGLRALSGQGADPASVAAETQVAARLASAAAGLRDAAGYVRLGEAKLHQTSFPVYLPFVGTAHLAWSTDVRDPRMGPLLRAILLQALATSDAGRTEVLTVDTAAVGATFAPFQALVDARVMASAATDAAGMERVLTRAEEHVKAGLRGERGGTLIVAIASAGEWREPALSRLTALARSGVGAGLQLLVAGVEELPEAFHITVDGDMWVANGPNAPLSTRGMLAAPVGFDPPVDDGHVRAESVRIAERARAAAELRFVDLVPESMWSQDPASGVSTLVGRDAHDLAHLSFDDTTPHWLIGGRTGGGKTVFLLDVLYGLAARYSPRDLALYLLDFKEGVSFTEFTPQESDPTFIPHARTVGVESDREYGVAVLRELDTEMTRRSVVMKRRGVARYSELTGPERPPRIVCIVDEFQVLFAGNDSLARDAVAVLENLARKGRSYGVHLVLASQTTSGIEALYNKQESIFGQFPMRVALPGATSVLDQQNTAAQNLRTGEAVINTDGGIAGRDRKIRFPNAHAEGEELYRLRHEMWTARGDIAAPTVFYGYAAVHLEDDPVYDQAGPADQAQLLVGRNVNADLDTAAVWLDATPGRHLAILGAESSGAQTLHAAALSLARQRPHARFIVAPFAEAALARHTAEAIGAETVTVDKVPSLLDELAEAEHTYLIGFGADAMNLDYGAKPKLGNLLRSGPGRDVHVLGWWRGIRRFSEDVGKEDIACCLVLNIPGQELISQFGNSVMDWEPRTGRGLLIDRHANNHQLVVPFTQREAQ